MRIPNSFLTDFKSPSDLKLACVFYSLIHARTEKNLLGYVITVKQEVLANLCGCSVSTVKRSIASLRRLGFIKSQKRIVLGKDRLGAYMYTIADVPVQRNYFVLERSLIRKVNGQAFKVYAMFCKLADSNTRSFYQSLNDLSEMLCMDKKDVIKSIQKLISLKLIRKCRRLTRNGDFTDNTYIICKYVTNNKIHGRQFKAKKITAPAIASKGLSVHQNGANLKYSFFRIHHFEDFVKTFFAKILKLRRKISDKGSGENELI